MPIRVVFADLDGTLLNRLHTVSHYTQNVLRRLHTERPEVKFVVATGRPYPDVIESMRLLDLHPDYIISNNGAVVHEGGTSARVCEHTLSPDVVRRLLALPLPCEATDGSAAVPVVAANLFREAEWVSTYKVAGMGRSYRPTFQPRVTPDLAANPHYHQHVYSLFYYGPHEYLLPLQDILQRDYAREVSASFSTPFILDVSPPSVDKGTAIGDVLKLLQLTPQEAAAFGDGMNDLPMLRAVRHGFVMANALPSLLAATPDMERIGSNEDDGVAKKLEAIFFP